MKKASDIHRSGTIPRLLRSLPQPIIFGGQLKGNDTELDVFKLSSRCAPAREVCKDGVENMLGLFSGS